MLSRQLKKQDEVIVFTGDYLEMYIPEVYFERKFAESYGDSVQVFGLFSIRTFTGSRDGSYTPNILETLNIPAKITIFPVDVERRKLALLPESGEQSYMVAKFYKDDVMMRQNYPQDSSNVELFIHMLFRGNVPNTIPYSQIITIWHTNLAINNVKIGVSSSVLEVIVTEIYRDRENPERTFAKALNDNPNMSEYDYRTATIREICAWNSTFAAMTFEDTTSMITSALNTAKSGRKQTTSPIEKIIKM